MLCGRSEDPKNYYRVSSVNFQFCCVDRRPSVRRVRVRQPNRGVVSAGKKKLRYFWNSSYPGTVPAPPFLPPLLQKHKKLEALLATCACACLLLKLHLLDGAQLQTSVTGVRTPMNYIPIPFIIKCNNELCGCLFCFYVQ